jgi:hypothetical protein
MPPVATACWREIGPGQRQRRWPGHGDNFK